MSHISITARHNKINIYTKNILKMHIKPKIYQSLDKASYNESSLQYLYCA